MGLFNTVGIKMTEQGLDALWLKQQVIGHNLANSSTPGYKARYVTFSEKLKKELKCKAPEHIYDEEHYHEQVEETSNGLFDVKIGTAYDKNRRPDENDVDVDQQNLELARTQIQYDLLSRSMSTHMSMLKSATNAK